MILLYTNILSMDKGELKRKFLIKLKYDSNTTKQKQKINDNLNNDPKFQEGNEKFENTFIIWTYWYLHDPGSRSVYICYHWKRQKRATALESPNSELI